MKRIQLPGTGRSTSQLGFGCSSLMSATGRKESMALLEEAFEVGIRHFDVAPMYGYGAAEGCLGDFLSRHPGQVSVTTKYGIGPPAKSGLVQAARTLARPLFKLVPGLKKRLASSASRNIAVSAPKAAFTAAEARASLDRSLAALQFDSLDLLLLHEAEDSDLQDSELLTFLEDAVTAGKIGAFGVGSSGEKIPALLAHRPEYCHVLQFEWSILDKPVAPSSAFTLHHRALTSHFSQLQNALSSDHVTQRRWSGQIDADLAQPGILAALMLKAALVLNAESIILVSSKDPKHIRSNVRVAEDEALAAPARELYRLMQNEGATVLTGR